MDTELEVRGYSSSVRTLAARRPILLGLVAVALVLALLLGGRAAWRLYVRFNRPPPPPRQTDVTQIAGWMSVPYVARAYRVPAPELYAALGVPPEDRGSRQFSTLDEIAERTGRPSEEVVETVRATVTAWQETHPPPDRGGAPRDGPPGDRSPGGPGRGKPGPDGPPAEKPAP